MSPRPRIWHIAALALLLGACSESHGADGGAVREDGAIRDDGGSLPVDAGPFDAGPYDAGSFDAGPPIDGGEVCRGATVSPIGSGCEPSLCGDGVRDTCSTCGPCMGGPPGPFDAGSCCTPSEEQCDGADLGGASCESLGYASGALRCGGWCGFDTSGCDVCAFDARIEECEHAAVDPAAPGSLALATSDDEIAIAWTTRAPADGSGRGGEVHFARFSPDLVRLSESPCLGSDARHVALARVPSGWLLAASGSAGMILVPLDPLGLPRGPTRTLAGAFVPDLAERPDGGPLLIYVTASRSTVRAALLDEDGDAAWDAPIFTDVVEAEYGDAVFVGDGFLVTQRAWSGVGVRRVELDGRLGTTSLFPGDSTEYPQLTWLGTSAQMTWADFSASPRQFTARLDRTGAPVTMATLLSSEDFNPARMVTVNGDAVVFLPSYTGWTGHGRRVAFARLGPTGPIYAPVTVANEPEFFFEPRVAALGDRVILAWLSAAYPGGIRLARVVP